MNDQDILNVLNELAKSHLPFSLRNKPEHILTHAGTLAAINDLPNGGKNFDLKDKDQLIAATRAIWAMQSNRLDKAYKFNITAKIQSRELNETDALKCVLLYGAKGALPKLQKMLQAGNLSSSTIATIDLPQPQIIADQNISNTTKTDQNIQSIANTKSNLDDKQITLNANTADPLYFVSNHAAGTKTGQTEPFLNLEEQNPSPTSSTQNIEAPQAPTSGLFALSKSFGSPSAEEKKAKSKPSFIAIYDGIINGHVCNEFECRDAGDGDIETITKQVQSITNDPKLFPFQHQADKSGALDFKVAQSLQHFSRGASEANEILEQSFALQPLFTAAPIRLVDMLQQPNYGYAKGARALKLQPGSHTHKTHHDDVAPNIIGLETNINQTQYAGKYTILHNENSNTQIHFLTNIENSALKATNYSTFDKKPIGLQSSYQYSSTTQILDPDLNITNRAQTHHTQVMLHKHGKEHTLGAGLSLQMVQNNQTVQKPNLMLATEISLLDPWTAKHGLRMQNEFGKNQLQGVISIASEIPKLSTTSYAINYAYTFEKQQKPEHEIEAELFIPLTPNTGFFSHFEHHTTHDERQTALSIEANKALNTKGTFNGGISLGASKQNANPNKHNPASDVFRY